MIVQKYIPHSSVFSGMQKKANTKIIVRISEGELGNGVGDGGTESWLAPLSPSSL